MANGDRFRYLLQCASVLLLAGWMSCLAGQDRVPASVWEGIYTNEQAARGEAAYRQACASCHGARMEGRGHTPPLAGSDFTEDWDCTSVSDLFEKIQISMPADRPGLLSEMQSAAILAYILRFNNFPAGSKELPANADALRGILFDVDSISQ